MGLFNSTPKRTPYEEMSYTPWITQAIDIADRGGKGIIENYNKVNSFSPEVLAGLTARNNDVYQRAYDDFNQQYNDTMRGYQGKNYNQFGTLNATPASYATDMYGKAQQRALADLSYNKAMNYEDLVNNELNRRYNNLNLYNTMYQFGQTPYEQDLKNWEIRNKNNDRNYENMIDTENAGGGIKGAVKGGITGFMAGGPIGALAGAGLGAIPKSGSGGAGYFGDKTGDYVSGALNKFSGKSNPFSGLSNWLNANKISSGLGGNRISGGGYGDYSGITV